MKVLLGSGANIDATDHIYQSGRTALHYAALSGHIEVVKVLVERGAAINTTDHADRTVLHEVALSGHVEVVKVLLDRGAP